MKLHKLFNFLYIDEHSSTPKYLQLCNSIISIMEEGKIKSGENLPSINEICSVLDISRATVEKGYNSLKDKGIILSVPGKGYYFGELQTKREIKIFLLFNKLSAHKKVIYDALVESIGKNAVIDLNIYNNDYSLFKKLLLGVRQDYSHYVIIPHFTEGGDEVYKLLDTLPKDKLILLDKSISGIRGNYCAIYENFEKDIYNALVTAKQALNKYHTLKIVFPKRSYYPKEIINGFNRFCQQFAFNHQVINEVLLEPIDEGQVFINLMEDDLAPLVERIIASNLIIGKQVGLISYNETPLKKLLLNGVTTISTDFSYMGRQTADCIINKKNLQIEVPFKLILRPSL